ncbi:hypothetical protein [Serratia marcescens]|uniref:hypothetical protein n=1 Tax=Serratia marcescens TaxID=615 RepID=UPI00148BA718|nr:hypothetical protein [Serratia marcescens]QJU39666.1 hypothetical protein HMI62_10205 [Serratia marcescens]
MEMNMRTLTFKMLSICGLLLISQACISSSKYSNADDIADKVFGKQNLVGCRLPAVDIDVANRIIDKFNDKKLSCENNGAFSINGKKVSGVSINDMSGLVRESVFACQDYTVNSFPVKPQRNSCVRKIESDVDYFLLMTRDKRVKSFPWPYGFAVSRTSIGGQFINFKLWANRALLGVADSNSR